MQSETALLSDYRSLKSPFDESHERSQDLVFSHNDFQENNVLINNVDNSTLTLIDFEYSCTNYRGYDIASFVNEQFMDYTEKGAPFFKIHPEEYLTYLTES